MHISEMKMRLVINHSAPTASKDYTTSVILHEGTVQIQVYWFSYGILCDAPSLATTHPEGGV
jgi:hypothetical protein